MKRAAASLLGLPVLADGVPLGAVEAVFVDEGGSVLAVEVGSSWTGAETRLLPWPAARLQDGVVHGRAVAFLSRREAAYYRRRGAQVLTRVDAPPSGVSPAGAAGRR